MVSLDGIGETLLDVEGKHLKHTPISGRSGGRGSYLFPPRFQVVCFAEAIEEPDWPGPKEASPPRSASSEKLIQITVFKPQIEKLFRLTNFDP